LGNSNCDVLIFLASKSVDIRCALSKEYAASTHPIVACFCVLIARVTPSSPLAHFVDRLSIFQALGLFSTNLFAYSTSSWVDSDPEALFTTWIPYLFSRVSKGL
jgi:hypothetical protein